MDLYSLSKMFHSYIGFHLWTPYVRWHLLLSFLSRFLLRFTSSKSCLSSSVLISLMSISLWEVTLTYHGYFRQRICESSILWILEMKDKNCKHLLNKCRYFRSLRILNLIIPQMKSYLRDDEKVPETSFSRKTHGWFWLLCCQSCQFNFCLHVNLSGT